MSAVSVYGKFAGIAAHPWRLSEMEGKDADWFLKYRDGVIKEL